MFALWRSFRTMLPSSIHGGPLLLLMLWYGTPFAEWKIIEKVRNRRELINEKHQKKCFLLSRKMGLWATLTRTRWWSKPHEFNVNGLTSIQSTVVRCTTITIVKNQLTLTWHYFVYPSIERFFLLNSLSIRGTYPTNASHSSFIARSLSSLAFHGHFLFDFPLFVFFFWSFVHFMFLPRRSMAEKGEPKQKKVGKARAANGFMW